MFSYFNDPEQYKAQLAPTEQKIMDRFIPRVLSSHSYRSRLDEPVIVDEALLNLGSTSINEGSRLLDITAARRLLSGERSALEDVHSKAIRDLLEFIPDRRVFSFVPQTPQRRSFTSGLAVSSSGGKTASDSSANSGSGGISARSSDIFSRVIGTYSSSITSFESDISSMASPSKKRKVPIKSNVPLRVLDAPSLTNDFYTNVVSWSRQSNRIAVGLASEVYLWREDEVACLLDLPEGRSVSCVSFSDGDYIIVGTKEGNVYLFSQLRSTMLDHYFNQSNGVCCIEWFPNKPNTFLAGDDNGSVLCIEILPPGKLNLIAKFKCHQQQVCGIAICCDGNQAAIGGNDNCCAIWDMKTITQPKLLFQLPHQAAVKAVAYCPWSKSLLATGGGSKDRTIRFWHSNSGTLLNTIEARGQVTSLNWSNRKKQITLTFGFGDTKKSKLIIVYSYPQMEELIQVDAAPNLRILSSALSPDCSTLCVASNDETVRFYQFWNPDDSVIMESPEGGVFGSELIDLSEGMTERGDSIR